MKNKRELIIALVICILLFGGVLKFGTGRTNNTSVQGTSSQISPTTSTSSNQCKNISNTDATRIVSNLPEVKYFLDSMAVARQKTIVTATQEGKNWSIHVAEDHPDHLATFNWYTIDNCAGRVKCSFVIYDGDGRFIRDSNTNEYPCN